MGDMKATSLGPCGACSRPIYQATPMAHVYRGIPKRAYLAHKECAENEGETAPKEPVVVVSDPNVFAASQLKADAAREAFNEQLEAFGEKLAQPSMPVKEQSGVRRGRGRPPGSKNKPR